MSKSRIFKRALPTDMGVKALIVGFPVQNLTAGYIIPYSTVETVLTAPKRSTRFTTVTNAWRKELERNYGIIVDCLTGEGFHVTSASDRLKLSHKKARSAERATERSMQVLTLTNVAQLNDEEKKSYTPRKNMNFMLMAISKMDSRIAGIFGNME